MRRRRAILTGVGVLYFLVLAGCSPVVSGLRPGADETITYENTYGTSDPFLRGIQQAETDAEPPRLHRIRAVVVPHHLAAPGSIASALRMLRYQSFSRIVLLSPDHFHRCPTQLCVTNGSFQTLFGVVRPSATVVDALTRLRGVTVDAQLFQEEHGVFAVLPFVAHFFPGVPVTPVALSQNFRTLDLSSLHDILASVIDDDTLLIVSTDFSHYLSLGDAETMDEQTMQTIFAKDLDGIATLHNPSQSDCPNCLWALARLADERGFYNPSILHHTNSANLLSQPNLDRTTSHFSMVWYADAELSSSDNAVAGDVTLTRTMEKLPSLPRSVREFWAGKGVRLVNVEGPIAETCLPNADPYVFCNRFDDWKELQHLATHWGIENNHMFDLGSDSPAVTERLLRSKNATVITVNGHEDDRARIVAMTEVLNPVAGTRSTIEEGFRKAKEQLRRWAEKPSNVPSIVYLHGGREYSVITDVPERDVLRSFIDAGADAVVVTHSHMPGDVEIYKDRPIFRGLGNFLFDQHDRIATSTAKIVRLRKENGRMLFQTFTGK